MLGNQCLQSNGPYTNICINSELNKSVRKKKLINIPIYTTNKTDMKLYRYRQNNGKRLKYSVIKNNRILSK